MKRLGVLAAAAVAVAAAAPAAHAAGWGYEQISPAGGAPVDVLGTAVAREADLAVAGTGGDPIPGQRSDGRVGAYTYVLEAGGLWPVGPIDVANGIQPSVSLGPLAADGRHLIMSGGYAAQGGGAQWAGVDGSLHPVGTGGGLSAAMAATPNLELVAYTTGHGGSPAYVRAPGGAPAVVSLDDSDAPMTAMGLGGFVSIASNGMATNALAADGSSLIFPSEDERGGDHDGTQMDLYRRVLTPGAERTILITDVTDNGDPDPMEVAEYRWASADHSRVLWSTREALGDGDTDAFADLYLRVGEGAPIRVTKGELVNGVPTGNEDTPQAAAQWAASSDDGNLVYFISGERLTQDAPAAAGQKLYERDVAAGVTRFVAGPLGSTDVAAGYVQTTQPSLIAENHPGLSFRAIRVTPSGVVFHSVAPLAGDGDGQVDVFAWSRVGGLTLLSGPAAGAPASPSADATLVAPRITGRSGMGIFDGGRSVSVDGARVFFTTAESLTAQDTDGGFSDVYAWTAGQGLALVTPPGDAQQDAYYVGSNAAGTRVWFHTREGILGGDTDPAAMDVYQAVLGGGSAPTGPQYPSGPSGPGAPAGAPPSVPTNDGPASASATPLPPEPPAPVHQGPAPPAGDDRIERATLEVHPARRLGEGGVAELRLRTSVAGRVSITARARLSRKRRRASIGSATLRVGTDSERAEVELSRRALRRLERRGALRVRFVVRLRPSGDARPVTERITLKLRSGERR